MLRSFADQSSLEGTSDCIGTLDEIYENTIGDPAFRKPMVVSDISDPLAQPPTLALGSKEVIWHLTMNHDMSLKKAFPTDIFNGFSIGTASSCEPWKIINGGCATLINVQCGEVVWIVGYDSDREGLHRFEVELNEDFDWCAPNLDTWMADGIVLGPGSAM